MTQCRIAVPNQQVADLCRRFQVHRLALFGSVLRDDFRRLSKETLMPFKPWRSVVDPREDLRKGEALHAAEFAVHLDMVQDQRGNAIYWQPEQFFSRTYLTATCFGSRGEAATLPYGFFRWWRLEKNTGKFAVLS